MKYYLTQEGVNLLNETRSDASRLRMIIKKKIKKGGAGRGGGGTGRPNVGIRGGHGDWDEKGDSRDAITLATKTYDLAATKSLGRLGGGASVKTHKDPWVRMSAMPDPPGGGLRKDAAAQLKTSRAFRYQTLPTNPHKPGTAEHDAREEHLGKHRARLARAKKNFSGRLSDFEGRSETQTPFFDKEAKERIAGGVKAVKKARVLRSVRDAQPHSRRNR